jgi:hypothetical protein
MESDAQGLACAATGFRGLANRGDPQAPRRRRIAEVGGWRAAAFAAAFRGEMIGIYKKAKPDAYTRLGRGRRHRRYR